MTDKQLNNVIILRAEFNSVMRRMKGSPVCSFVDRLYYAIIEPLSSECPKQVNAKHYIEKVFIETEYVILKTIPNLVVPKGYCFKSMDSDRMERFADTVVKSSSSFGADLKHDGPGIINRIASKKSFNFDDDKNM